MILMTNVLTADDIEKMLPHRYPFLMIDKVIDLVPGQKATGIKSVSINEPYFQGHFPNHKVMPGVLIIEACGQLAGLVKLSEKLEGDGNPLFNHNKVEYLASVIKFNFKHTVSPGDQLIIKAFNFKIVQNLMQVNVQAMVKTTLVAEGVLVITITNN